VAIGGASPRVYQGMEAFQEIDQLAVFQAGHQVGGADLRRQAHPDVVATAFARRRPGARGRLHRHARRHPRRKVEEDAVTYAAAWKPAPRTLGDPRR